MRGFVPDAVAAGVDFSGLRRINAKFHVDRQSAERREGDVIWRLPTHEGIDVYLYLLIEFQRRSDWWMAVRTQVYQGLLWQHVIKENKLKRGSRLPPVLLLVLYNGQRRWKAPTEVTELIGLQPDSALWHWQPQVRYYLLDMGAFAGAGLAGRASLAALLFRLERCPAADELRGLIDEVTGWFRGHPDYEPLKQLFGELVHQAVVNLGTSLPTPDDDLGEVTTMFERIGEVWKERYLAEGKANLLVRLLVKRFGPLEPSLQARIQAADVTTVESWFDRAIDASDLTAVFNPPRSAR